MLKRKYRALNDGTFVRVYADGNTGLFHWPSVDAIIASIKEQMKNSIWVKYAKRTHFKNHIYTL